MQCKNCKHWQGNRFSEWGDCYRIVAKLEPHLLNCYREDENRPGLDLYFSIPFDPHNTEYWKHNTIFHKLLRNAIAKARDTNGIRVDVHRWIFFQTRGDYSCYES